MVKRDTELFVVVERMVATSSSRASPWTRAHLASGYSPFRRSRISPVLRVRAFLDSRFASDGVRRPFAGCVGPGKLSVPLLASERLHRPVEDRQDQAAQDGGEASLYVEAVQDEGRKVDHQTVDDDEEEPQREDDER